MSDRGERRLSSRALLALLALPLLVVAVTASAYVVPAGKGAEPPPAVGSLAGGFHPVAGSFEADDIELNQCDEAEYLCLEQGFGNLAYRRGPGVALRLFERRIATDADVEADCHRIAHSIGSGAFARFDGDVARAFSLGSSTCASGYYHGILERAFVGVRTMTQLESVARKLCLGRSIRPRSFLDYQCQHGLGHGLMIQTGYRLPQALAVCRGLANGWNSVVCTSGVFMENVNTRYGFRSQWLKDDDPFYPCGDVRVEHRRSCYLRATRRVLELNQFDFEATVAKCASLRSPWGRYCFRGYGRDVVNEAHYRAPKILSLCALAGPAEGECLYAAARTIGDGFAYDGMRRAVALCRAAKAHARADCFRGVGLTIGLLYDTNARRRKACDRFAGAHARTCTPAALAEVRSQAEVWG